MGSLIYVDRDEWDDRFLRINIFVVLPNLWKWLKGKRPKVLRDAEAYVQRVDRFVVKAQRKQRMEALRAKPGKTFNDYLILLMYDMEASIARDLTRQMFASSSLIERVKGNQARFTVTNDVPIVAEWQGIPTVESELVPPNTAYIINPSQVIAHEDDWWEWDDGKHAPGEGGAG